jgi:uncharacterized protein
VKVFLDTNVLVSALATRGLSADLLERLLEEGTQLLTCPQVIAELRRVMAEKFHVEFERMLYTPQLLERLTSVPESDAPPARARSISDPDDIPILGCALAAGAELFVTGDKALLELKTVEGMAIVSPRQAWERLAR